MQRLKRQSIVRSIIYGLLLLVIALTCVPIGALTLYADNEYSDVLQDLRKDNTFDIEDYPTNATDYSINVIQIAESTNGELLIYTYQPSVNSMIVASSINISTGINDNVQYRNYKLTQLSRNKQFVKYLVQDFAVKSDALRYYDIPSIFRVWQSDIDKPASGDNTVQEVPYTIAKLYTASTVQGVVSYTCTTTEVIVVSDKYVGFVRYDNGFKLYQGSCDSHYIAFSTDIPIEQLYEADVSYISKLYTSSTSLVLGERVTYQDPVSHDTTLQYTDKASNSAGLWGTTYTWNRIESVSDFLSNENVNDDTKSLLIGKSWILRFCETPYSHNSGTGGTSYKEGTAIEEVTILRLKFETQGVVYNLGVVDNKQSGSLIPDNKPDNWWERLLWILLAIVLVIVLIPLLPTILRALVVLIKYIAIIIWYIIKYLAIGIYWLFAWPFYLKK